MTPILALLGAKALYLLLAWLASGIVCSYLSQRAGYGEKIGLATGLLLTVPGLVIWLVVYFVAPRPNSLRKVEGVLPKRRKAADMQSAPEAPASSS